MLRVACMQPHVALMTQVTNDMCLTEQSYAVGLAGLKFCLFSWFHFVFLDCASLIMVNRLHAGIRLVNCLHAHGSCMVHAGALAPMIETPSTASRDAPWLSGLDSKWVQPTAVTVQSTVYCTVRHVGAACSCSIMNDR